ncbi:holo-ACP synthase [Paenibacillus physcomitrellae]|uniref:Holo-[acyl-carrier-protein] synthase n=1 Tax=Paenibacillus physcomitrellae TaxID=1619311 RepID=A0ABQ1FY32_9BACL|nr:holo-ACP synthase [Paenibacillus physcomitrellae]GGA32725.1 holo-[acyl-carrier-protein] synthase [Paenibacillus physcomitrellae]
MIYGIGHDLVEIERMDRILKGSSGSRFLQRILTPAERELPGATSRKAEFAAGRFAAKEAVSKAFGCGIGAKLAFDDIEILPDPAGKPFVTLNPEAWDRLGWTGKDLPVIHISITHERSLASAFCVLEQG